MHIYSYTIYNIIIARYKYHNMKRFICVDKTDFLRPSYILLAIQFTDFLLANCAIREKITNFKVKIS